MALPLIDLSAAPAADTARWHIDGWPVKRGFDPLGWQALDPGQPPVTAGQHLREMYRSTTVAA